MPCAFALSHQAIGELQSLLQNYLQTIGCVRARLQSCRNWPIAMPALSTAELQISENKPAGAKAQRDLFALSARLKSCPDTLCSFNGILQDARGKKYLRWGTGIPPRAWRGSCDPSLGWHVEARIIKGRPVENAPLWDGFGGGKCEAVRTGPRVRGTGGTHSCGRTYIRRDRGHPPTIVQNSTCSLVSNASSFSLRDYSMTTVRISGGVVHNLPADLRKGLTLDAQALAAWEDITPLARNEWICWTISVKKEETRRQHVERVCSELKDGMRRPCCWPGCPHR